MLPCSGKSQGKLVFIQGQGKFCCLSAWGISKSLLKVSEKSGNFILRYFFRCFCIGKNNHPAWSVKIFLTVSEKSGNNRGFILFERWVATLLVNVNIKHVYTVMYLYF